MCLLGEPTEGKVVLGHFGALWLRIRVHGNFIHTAFSEGKRDQNSILRAHEVLDAVQEWIPTWEDDPVELVPRREGDRQRRRDRGRLRLARLAHAASHRSLPRRPRAADEGDGRRAPRGARVGALARASASPTRASRARSTSRRRAPRSTRGTSSSPRSTRRTSEVFGAKPERDVTRWFSDASALTRYGDPDGQLRHLDRADGRRARREPRDRRAREDGGDLRARRDGGVRCRELTSTRCRRTCRCPRTTARPITSSGSSCPTDARVVAGRRERPRLRRDLRLSAHRPAGRAAAARLGRDAGRARLHAAVVRVPRRSTRTLGVPVAGLSAQSLDDQLEFAERNRDAVPRDRRSGAAARRRAAPADVRDRGAHPLQAPHARRRGCADREGLLSRLPARRERRRRPRVAARRDEARHVRRRQGRADRRRGDRAPRRADDARVLRARRRRRRGRARRRSPTRRCARRSSRRSSSTPPATSASTRRSRRTSTGRTRSRRGSSSSRTSTRSSAPTSRSSIPST